ncbi:hypothetical protein [Aerococcus loyolae]|uniref:Uncharacterized protein n=1 Tax=Aerococcus urinae TaxID=1376 RepID=A0A329NVQ1_9LACT|nr:hypothetical protein [Aerococcus loyolae]RAV76581.1 hypothetical protein DBT54_09715 [Aerococcus loyolae]
MTLGSINTAQRLLIDLNRQLQQKWLIETYGIDGFVIKHGPTINCTMTRGVMREAALDFMDQVIGGSRNALVALGVDENSIRNYIAKFEGVPPEGTAK